MSHGPCRFHDALFRRTLNSSSSSSSSSTSSTFRHVEQLWLFLQMKSIRNLHKNAVSCVLSFILRSRDYDTNSNDVGDEELDEWNTDSNGGKDDKNVQVGNDDDSSD